MSSMALAIAINSRLYAFLLFVILIGSSWNWAECFTTKEQNIWLIVLPVGIAAGFRALSNFRKLVGYLKQIPPIVILLGYLLVSVICALTIDQLSVLGVFIIYLLQLAHAAFVALMVLVFNVIHSYLEE